MVTSTVIKVVFQDVGYRKVKQYQSLRGAQAAAQKYLGTSVEFGQGYAVGMWGNTVRVYGGATLADVFPEAWARWQKEMAEVA